MIRESIHFALHGSTVHCHFSLADDLWPVEVDIGQIGQVINNLGINAVQAMPRGGIIEVLAENVTVTKVATFPWARAGQLRQNLRGGRWHRASRQST